MPSTTTENQQIIIRCLMHRPTDGVKVPYVAALEPLGDGLSVLCGRKVCDEAGLVWMTAAAWSTYKSGEREFWPRTLAVCIRVGETVRVSPK